MRRLALFGSVVRNQATPASDVDVLVEFDPAMKTLDTFMELAFLLDEVLGRRADVVTTEANSSTHDGDCTRATSGYPARENALSC